MLLTFQSFIQLTVPFKPKKNSIRVFFISMLLFSLLISFFYQSMLSGVLTRPNYEKQVKTVENFAKSSISLKCWKLYCLKMFANLEEDIQELLMKKLIDTRESGLEQLLNFVNRCDHAFISSPLHLFYIRNFENLERIKVIHF